MTHWSATDAKANFSKLLDASLREGPQVVTRRGVDTAVLVPIEEWRTLTNKPHKSAIEVLLHDPRRFELELPKRSALWPT